MRKADGLTMGAIFLVLILWAGILIGISGCATTSLPAGATADQKRAAMCQDSQMGIGLAAIGISTATNPGQTAYWQKYLNGAQAAHDLACPSMSKLPIGAQ